VKNPHTVSDFVIVGAFSQRTPTARGPQNDRISFWGGALDHTSQKVCAKYETFSSFGNFA
jgi:hypothetical protein